MTCTTNYNSIEVTHDCNQTTIRTGGFDEYKLGSFLPYALYALILIIALYMVLRNPLRRLLESETKTSKKAN